MGQKNRNSKLLLLEDETELCEIYVPALEASGFTVSVHSKVQSALLNLSEGRYEVAIFDERLKDGSRATHLIQNRFLLPHFPEFFVLTGDPDFETADDSTDYEVLPKPIELSKLVEKAQELWKKRVASSRKFRRRPTRLLGELVIGGDRQDVEIQDISLEGVRVHVRHTPEKDIEGFLRIFPVPVEPKCLLGKTRVVWDRANPNGGWEIGLTFLEPLQPLRSFLSLLKTSRIQT